MKSVGYFVGALVLASLISAFLKLSVLWIAIPLLAFALIYSLLRVCLYRPPEDHLGVIYRLDRLWRLAEPDDWTFVLPILSDVKDPVSMQIRRVEVNLFDLLTRDRFPVDCRLLVFYQLDLRRTAAGFLAQALGIPDDGWNSIVRTVLQEAASEVMGGFPLQKLLTARGRRHLKLTLSQLLAERVQHLGLIVNPQTGVSVQELKPAGTIWQAMVDRLAAVSLGEAALARVQPMLEELSHRYPEIAWDALLLEWAAGIARDGSIPDVLVTPSWGPVSPALPARDQREPDGRRDGRLTVLDLDSRRQTGPPPKIG